MKNYQTVFFIVSFWMIAFSSQAKKVELSQIQKVATQLASQNNLSPTLRSSDLTLVQTVEATVTQQEETACYHVFNVGNNDGFVIVSGDDVAIPVIAYSTEGSFDPNNIPPEMAWWMEQVKAEISAAISEGISATPEITAEWQSYLTGGNPLKSTTAVSPLVTTTWGQDSPYNDQCPRYNNERLVTGCVATAMAQIMKYNQTPSARTVTIPAYTTESLKIKVPAITGSTTYSWRNMANSYNRGNSAPDVATLMYHCGVSVAMDYDPEGSGAYCSDIPYALYTYFGYDKSVMHINRGLFSDADWVARLKQELDAGRPLLYGGADPDNGGHAWVCDGYDNSNKFHMNWGWDGSVNGYFSVGALTPKPGSSSFNFSQYQEAVVNIKPDAGGDISYFPAMYSNLTSTATTSTCPETTFTVVANEFINLGDNTFPASSECAAVLVDANNKVVVVLGSLKIGQELPFAYYFTPTFRCSVPASVANGNYQLRAAMRPNTTASWTLAATYEGTVFSIPFTVNRPVLNVSQSSLAFDNTPTQVSSSPRTISVSGSALTANITYQLTGTDASAFTLTETSWQASTGGTLSFTFKPTQEKSYSAILTITSGCAESQTVTLTGTGTQDGIPQLYSGGEGTKTSPYLISSKTDMEALAVEVNGGNNYAGNYFLLTQNLTGVNDTITTVIAPWTDAPFSGNFDGGDHRIAVNINVSVISAVFGCIENATIKNLGVSGFLSATSKENSYTSGICGIANLKNTISDCYNTGMVKSHADSRAYAGSICGWASSTTTITDCYNRGTLDVYAGAYPYTGGICGISNGIISNCYNIGRVDAVSLGSPSVGGICGLNYNIIDNCYNTGTIGADGYSSLSETCAGGICGLAYGAVVVSDCYNTGSVSASASLNQSCAGGICGLTYGESGSTTPAYIRNCFAANTSISSKGKDHYQERISDYIQNSARTVFENCYALSSMSINGGTVSSDNVADAKGQDALFTSFQSQSWIASHLKWDFSEEWVMSDINSVNQGLPILQELDDATSIPYIAGKSTHTISVYPNPATDFVTVSGLQGRETITIRDLSGKLVQSRKATGTTESFAVGGLPKGVYLVQISNGESVKLVKK
jgi:hypothetical protein